MLCCDPYFHKVTAATDMQDAVELTTTNSTNIAHGDCYKLKLCATLSTVVTGGPVPVNIVVNGTPVVLKNRWGVPIKSNEFTVGKVYYGAYMNDGTENYVMLNNNPTSSCPRAAL